MFLLLFFLPLTSCETSFGRTYPGNLLVEESVQCSFQPSSSCSKPPDIIWLQPVGWVGRSMMQGPFSRGFSSGGWSLMFLTMLFFFIFYFFFLFSLTQSPFGFVFFFFPLSCSVVLTLYACFIGLSFASLTEFLKIGKTALLINKESVVEGTKFSLQGLWQSSELDIYNLFLRSWESSRGVWE